MSKTTANPYGTNRYSIREQTPGRFTARWYDDAGKRKSKTFATKTEAKRFLDNIKSDRNRGDYIDPADAQRTFKEVGELWFESLHLRPKTARAYRSILDQRLYPTFGERPVGAITTLDIVAWISDLAQHGKRVGHNNKGEPDLTNANTARAIRYRERVAARGGSPRAGKPLAPGTVRNAVRVLNQIMGAAVRARYIRGNPCDGLTKRDLPRHHAEPKNYLTAPEVTTLADAIAAEVRDHPARCELTTADGVDAARLDLRAEGLSLMIRFMAQTGLRAGEVVALKWGSVDLLRGRVTVRESVSMLKAGEWATVPPKNNRTRIVALTPAMVAELKAHANRHSSITYPAPESERKSVGRPGEAGDQMSSAFGATRYLWPSPVTSEAQPYGTEPMHWGRDFYLKYWKPAVARAALPGTLRAHDLRHTCASLLIAANVPAKAIQEHLGHSSFKITMDTYGHLYEDANDTLTSALGAAFAAPEQPSNVRQLWG